MIEHTQTNPHHNCCYSKTNHGNYTIICAKYPTVTFVLWALATTAIAVALTRFYGIRASLFVGGAWVGTSGLGLLTYCLHNRCTKPKNLPSNNKVSVVSKPIRKSLPPKPKALPPPPPKTEKGRPVKESDKKEMDEFSNNFSFLMKFKLIIDNDPAIGNRYNASINYIKLSRKVFDTIVLDGYNPSDLTIDFYNDFAAVVDFYDLHNKTKDLALAELLTYLGNVYQLLILEPKCDNKMDVYKLALKAYKRAAKIYQLRGDHLSDSFPESTSARCLHFTLRLKIQRLRMIILGDELPATDKRGAYIESTWLKIFENSTCLKDFYPEDYLMIQFYAIARALPLLAKDSKSALAIRILESLHAMDPEKLPPCYRDLFHINKHIYWKMQRREWSSHSDNLKNIKQIEEFNIEFAMEGLAKEFTYTVRQPYSPCVVRGQLAFLAAKHVIHMKRPRNEALIYFFIAKEYNHPEASEWIIRFLKSGKKPMSFSTATVLDAMSFYARHRMYDRLEHCRQQAKMLDFPDKLIELHLIKEEESL